MWIFIELSTEIAYHSGMRLILLAILMLVIPAKAFALIDWSVPHPVINIEMKTTRAPTYPVLEEPWKDYIVKKMREHRKEIMDKIAEIKRKIESGEIKYHPRAIRDIPFARRPRTRRVRLKLKLTAPIMDNHGRILYAKGTMVEPLRMMRLHSWIYVGAADQMDDRFQDALSRAPGRVIALITDGDVMSVKKSFEATFGSKVRVYVATRPLMERLHVERLPSIIHQDGDMLVIEEKPAKMRSRAEKGEAHNNPGIKDRPGRRQE